ENTSATITSAKLSASGDAGDAASEFVYTVTAAPAHGTLKLSGSALAVNGDRKSDEEGTNEVTYSQDGTDNNDSFAFSVADAPGTAATGTFNITFTEAAASVGANTGLSLGENTSATITSARLSASGDAGDAASEFVYTVTTAPAHGTLKLSGSALAVN